MRRETAAYSLELGNAALFVCGALQHAGATIGSLHEPVIVPASVVEVLCALALSWGAAAILKQSLKAWRAAFIGKLVAIIGVAIGMVALAVGAGPRTASNDLHRGIMLALATTSLVILVVPCTIILENEMATTTLKTSSLPREFVFNGSRIPDPDPQMSLDQVRDLLTPSYPEIATATLTGPEDTGTSLRYSFSRAIGSKG